MNSGRRINGNFSWTPLPYILLTVCIVGTIAVILWDNSNQPSKAQQEINTKSFYDNALKKEGMNDCEYHKIGDLVVIRCEHSSTTITNTLGKYSSSITVDSP